MSSFVILADLIGLVGGSIGLFLGALKLKEYINHYLTVKRKTTYHLYCARRFFEQLQFNSAISELEKVLELSPKHIQTQRFLIECIWNDTQYNKIPDYMDISLRASSFATFSEDELNAILAKIYHFQASKPALKNDISLLLYEARFLKTSDKRLLDAAHLLERADRLSHHKNAEVIIEMALIKALLAENEEEIQTATNYADNALTLQPHSAFVCFFAARTFDYCSLKTKPENSFEIDSEIKSNENGENNKSIFNHSRALELYYQATKFTSKQIHFERYIAKRAAHYGLILFQKISNKFEGGILHEQLSISVADRARYLEAFSSLSYLRSRNGINDCVEFWLCQLYCKAAQYLSAHQCLLSHYQNKAKAAEDPDCRSLEFTIQNHIKGDTKLDAPIKAALN